MEQKEYISVEPIVGHDLGVCVSLCFKRWNPAGRTHVVWFPDFDSYPFGWLAAGSPIAD